MFKIISYIKDYQFMILRRKIKKIKIFENGNIFNILIYTFLNI